MEHGPALWLPILINAAAKANDRTKAEKWLTDMKLWGIEPDGVSYSTAIHAWAMAHDAPRAEHWFQELCRSGAATGQTSPFCFDSVRQACARAGYVARATCGLQDALNARCAQVAHNHRMC